MNRVGFSRKATVIAFLTFAIASIVYSPIASAQETAGGVAAAPVSAVHLVGVALGLGLIVIGAGLGIGRFAAAAAEGIARQPSAADKISGAVLLPLVLLEGVAILAEIFVVLIILLNR